MLVKGADGTHTVDETATKARRTEICKERLAKLATPKDPERFTVYLDILQERMSWTDKIVLPLGPKLYIVQAKASKQWMVRCECGHDFCGWKENWKLSAHIHVRDSQEKMEEIYPRLMAPTATWQTIRECYCPECATLHDVEAPTPWYPVIRDFEPDADTFYKDWLGLQVPERVDA